METAPHYAKDLYEHLTALYGVEDSLPGVAADWLAHYPSVNTQRAYARSFKIFVQYARQRGIHPLRLRPEHAREFATYLTTLESRAGKQFSATTRQTMLSAASTFYQHWYLLREDFSTENPFAAVPRPRS